MTRQYQADLEENSHATIGRVFDFGGERLIGVADYPHTRNALTFGLNGFEQY